MISNRYRNRTYERYTDNESDDDYISEETFSCEQLDKLGALENEI